MEEGGEIQSEEQVKHLIYVFDRRLTNNQDAHKDKVQSLIQI